MTAASHTRRSGLRTILKVVGGLLAALAALALAFAFWPVSAAGLVSTPRPAADYGEAAQRVQAWQDSEDSTFFPECRVQLMTHGQKTERVIIFAHGYTTCPQQFQALGREFYDAGYNVLIAPMPHHGLADRMTDDQALLTAGELAAYADTVVDIARGLGDRVSMAGISGGGVATAWAAQHRPDLAQAVMIAPAFGFQQVPAALTTAALRAYSRLPNSFGWFDEVRQLSGVPAYAYPRYSTRALAQIMRLGQIIMGSARQTAPAAGSLLVITNANDSTVNNGLTAQVVGLWTSHGAAVRTYEFPAQLKLGHDLIDPTQPDQQVDLVYPELLQLITP